VDTSYNNNKRYIIRYIDIVLYRYTYIVRRASAVFQPTTKVIIPFRNASARRLIVWGVPRVTFVQPEHRYEYYSMCHKNQCNFFIVERSRTTRIARWQSVRRTTTSNKVTADRVPAYNGLLYYIWR
jgi:hypothetical protein